MQIHTFIRPLFKQSLQCIKTATHRFIGLACALSLLLFSCSDIPLLDIELDNEIESPAISVGSTFTIRADGTEQTITSSGATIRQVLDSSDIEVGLTDEVSPPLFEPAVPDSVITIVRISEEIESIERSVPFDRRSVRNETMSADEPPVIIQQGQNGLEELTVTIVYRDGIEVDRRITRVILVNEPVEEIMMIGVDVVAQEQDFQFQGKLAFINGSGAQLFNGSNSTVQNLNLGGVPDRRVFSLSPDGDWLLYTIGADPDAAATDSETPPFNQLWLLPTRNGARNSTLISENVLWAGWNPARRERPEIAFSTGVPTTVSPGWEANNDLWLAELDEGEVISDTLSQIVQPYPAVFGWWGGDYAWSPDGSQIGYSFANEIGTIPAERPSSPENLIRRQSLHTFVEYDTRSDWVWIPPLSWSPDGTLLAFSRHSGDEAAAGNFETWMLHVPLSQAGDENALKLKANSGIWSYPFWATEIGTQGDNRAFAWLKATNSQNTLSSSYALWLADEDGSNGRQIFPAEGLSGSFPRERGAVTWSGLEPHRLAFVYDDDLLVYDLQTETVQKMTDSDGRISHPTWAPYGAGR